MQDNKVQILPLCHFVPAPVQQTCTHSHFFFLLLFFWLPCRNLTTTSKSAAASRGGVLRRSDLPSLQEDFVSTPETCPYGSSSLFCCSVMERTLCWHHTELSIFWVLKCRQNKLQHQQGIHFSVKKTAGRFQKSFEHDCGCRKTPPPSGQRKTLLNMYCSSELSERFTLGRYWVWRIMSSGQKCIAPRLTSPDGRKISIESLTNNPADNPSFRSGLRNTFDLPAVWTQSSWQYCCTGSDKKNVCVYIYSILF